MIIQSKPYFRTNPYPYVKRVLESGWLGFGPVTLEFEEKFRKFIGAKNFIAVDTGTSAIHLSLDAADVKPGDEVVVETMTYIASIQPILWLGATPVFADVQMSDCNANLNDITKCVTEKTKAIVLVHYAGSPTRDLKAIIDFAAGKNISVIEDATHACGMTPVYDHLRNHFICFSFNPIKIITCGEGGGVAVKDDELAELIRKKRILGISKDTWHRYKTKYPYKYDVITTGYRYHMSDVNAAIGLAQLKDVNFFIKKRQKIVEKYNHAFAKHPCFKSVKTSSETTALSLYTIILNENIGRDKIIDYYKKNGISVGVNYTPNHQHSLLAQYKRHPLKNAESLGRRVISLPLHVGLSDRDVNKVIEVTLKMRP